MGWWGYGIYDGDETQSFHCELIERAKINTVVDSDMIYDGDWLKIKETIIPKKYKSQFIKSIDKIAKTLPNKKFWDESSALEWQMFGALLLDNKIRIKKEFKKKIVDATEFLMGDHADAFDEPSKRKKVLRDFLKKIKK